MEIQKIIDERFNLIENKLRNSFSSIKANDEEVKRQLSEIYAKLEKDSAELLDLNKKFDSSEKFRKSISRDVLKREVAKEVMPILDKKIDASLKSIKNENKEMKADWNRWADASDEKLNKGIEEMRANFAKLDKQSGYVIKSLKSSTGKRISEQNKLVDQYSAKIEAYSAELEANYAKSKKEMLAAVDRRINENNEEVAKLRGQVVYLKGRVNKTLGKEDASKKKDKTIFKNLVSLLADESPEMKVEVKKKAEKKPVKKLETKEGKGFFNSIVKSLSD